MMKRLRSRLRKFQLVVTGRETPAFILRRRNSGDPVPDDAEVALRLVIAADLIETGNMEEAREILATLTRPRGIRLTRRFALARLQRKAGDRAAALAEWKIIHKKVPGNAKAKDKVRKLEPRVAVARAAAFAAAGDFPAALGEVAGLLEHRPKHDRARRLRVEYLVAAGRADEAVEITRNDLARKPANRKPLCLLAAAREAAGDGPAALGAWREAAALGNFSATAVIARAGRTRRKPAAAPAIAEPDEPGVTETADGFFRVLDEAGLFRFLATVPETNVPPPAVLRRCYEIRFLFVHNAIEQALAGAESLLGDAAFTGTDDAHAALRVSGMRAVRLRCLARLGRHAEAYQELAGMDFPDARTAAELELDLCWKQDPSRGLDAAARLWSLPLPSEKTSVLFCCLPLLAGDAEKAAAHLRMDFIRREHHDRRVTGDLILAAAAIHQALGGMDVRRRLFERYFRRFGLESPVTEENERAGYDGLDVSIAWRNPSGPRVSVIMTAYNAEATVEQALWSILGQTHANIEVILVDDASTDATNAVLTRIAASDPRVRLFRNTRNSGTYVSKNFALGIMSGGFFMFHDADDWAHPRRIERHLSRMRENPDLAVTTSDWFRMDESGAPVLRPLTGRFTHMNPGSMFCHASVRDEVGFFDCVRIDADMEYMQRIRAHYGPGRIAKIAAPLTIGRFHAASLTRSGAGALDDEGFSQVRGAYRTDTFHWRIGRVLAAGSLFLGPDADARDLPADRGIKVPHPAAPVACG